MISKISRHVIYVVDEVDVVDKIFRTIAFFLNLCPIIGLPTLVILYRIDIEPQPPPVADKVPLNICTMIKVVDMLPRGRMLRAKMITGLLDIACRAAVTLGIGYRSTVWHIISSC
jgi:hypothetical protein